jgi:parallel beta-helix repeat protein
MKRMAESGFGFWKIVLTTALVVLFFAAFTAVANADTYYVTTTGDDGIGDGSSENPWRTIQHAVNTITEGDTIIVRDGTYNENVYVNKDHLTIKSEKGAASTIVQAENQDAHVFEVTADYVNISGFTVEGAGIGIYLNYAEHCNISSNKRSYYNYGFLLDHSSNNTISGNDISGNNYHGIDLRDSSNNTISGNDVNNNYHGIDLRDSSNNSISGNDVSGNTYNGIYLRDSSNNYISGNDVNNNYHGVYLQDSSNNSISWNTFVNDGLFVYPIYHNTVEGNTVEGNTVNGKPLVYLEDASDYRVEDAGQVILINCRNITVENLNLSNTCVGIQLLETEDSIIADNTVSGNNHYCIYLYSSSNNSISGNDVTLIRSSNNTISGNDVNNNYYGIYLADSSNNTIYLNNFMDNTFNAESYATYVWNSPSELTYTYNGNTYTNYLGNYWDDYIGSDANNDGIGDTPYPINSDDDNYPLVERFENYEIGDDTTPPTVTTVSPEDGAPDVAIDTVVTATFSEAMDSSTITKDNFTLAGTPRRGWQEVPPVPPTESMVSGTVTYDGDTYTATFTPDAKLEYNHEYTATLSTAITDKAGNPLAEEYGWGFNTHSLQIGDIVKATTNLHVRDVTDWNNPLDVNNIIFTMHSPDERSNPPYDVGKIVSGPKIDDQYGYNWWKTDWDNDEIGWSAEGPLDNPAEKWLVKTDKPFVKIQDLEDPFSFQGEYELNQTELRTEEKKEDVLQNVTKYAKMYKISPALIMAIIRQESDFNAGAIGDGGLAIGYMQLHWDAAYDAGYRSSRDTFEDYSEESKNLAREDWPTDGLDPETNIKYGCGYLKVVYNKHGNSPIYDYNPLKNTISAYNLGKTQGPNLSNRMCYVLGGRCNGEYTGVIEGKSVGGEHSLNTTQNSQSPSILLIAKKLTKEQS